MQTIDCPLQSNARLFPDDPALISGETIYTYNEFNTKVWEIADYFLEIGIKANDRVAIFAPNSLEYVIILYALFRIKAVACPVSTRLPEEALNDRLESINCDFLISSFNNILTSPKITFKKINLQQTIDQKRSIENCNPNKVFSFEYTQDATILFTSGSQNKPKAVLHTFGNHFFSAAGSNDHIKVAPHDRWFLTLPLYHVGGLSVLFRILLGKGTVVLPAANTDIITSITEHNITHISLVPTQLFRIIKTVGSNAKSLKKLKAILVGGSAVPGSLVAAALKLSLPIYTSYGSTEMTSQIATTELIEALEQSEQAKVLKYREARIGEHSEVFVRGKTLFKGYVIKDKIEHPFDGDGWFATGDLGSIMDQNALKITGRKDNMFISGGENIRPEEIERFLCQLDTIEQAIVVPIKHEEFGFRPVAFIKHAGSSELHKPEIIASLQNRLPKFMTPDAFYNWPTTIEESGLKINRSRLKQLIEENNPDIIPIN